MARSRYTSPLHASARFVAQRMLLKPLVWSLTSVKVLGREKLDDLERPYIVVSNHSSHLDAPLLMGAWPRADGRYLAANAAADYFFDVRWRKALTALFFNAFPVDRTGFRGRGGVATGLLDDGVPLLVFPEGTRSKNGEIGQFKPGAAALCVSRQVPCVPVALVGAYEAMPKGTNWPRRGRPPITVNIGAPLRPEPNETVMQFSERIGAAVRALSAEVERPKLGLSRRQQRSKAKATVRAKAKGKLDFGAKAAPLPAKPADGKPGVNGAESNGVTANGSSPSVGRPATGANGSAGHEPRRAAPPEKALQTEQEKEDA